nr:MAG TPA: hypothetical protein [Caudoviricetes sp.]
MHHLQSNITNIVNAIESTKVIINKLDTYVPK